MVEKNEIQENQSEEIEVDIQPDQPDQGAAASVDTDEELASYTKNVSKRINNKNQQVRAAEERAAQLEYMVRQQQAQLSAMQQSQVQQQATVIQKEEEALQAKETQADDLYKRAVESGDAELMSKADTLKSDISIQKEKIRLAKNRQQAVPQGQPVEQQYYQEPVGQQQETVEPTQEALGWYEKNKWYC